MFADEITSILSQKITFVPSASSADNMAAKCPFHKGGQEKRPSFYVYTGPTKSARQVTGSAFCHTCNEGWSFVSLLRKLGIGRSYVDAAREIVEELAPKKRSYYDQISLEMTVLPEVILGVFEYAPKSLLSDGFDKELLKEFDIGFDFARKRVIFPLRDHVGNLVGISGRSVTGDFPRYKIYKEELKEVASGYEFKKGRILWGLDRFYTTAMQVGLRSPVVVCEGFKAAMWVAQCGFPNVVALLGAHCSPEQKLLLSRVTNEVVLFLDNDGPGRKATYKVSKFLSVDTDVHIASYPSSKFGASPDDLRPEEVRAAIKKPLTKYEWRQSWADQKR